MGKDGMIHIAHHVRAAGLLPLTPGLIGPVFKIPRGAARARRPKRVVVDHTRRTFEERAAEMRERMTRRKATK